MPARWSNFLLSDRDERNEVVGGAREGFFPFVSVGFLLVEVYAEVLTVNFQLFGGSTDIIRGFDLQVVFGLADVLLFKLRE